MLKRFPPSKSIIPVFAVIVFMIYAWTIVHFLWALPSLFYYLNLGEILAVLSYRILVDLVESLAMIGVLLVASFVLPPRILRDAFIARGVAASAILIGSVMLFWDRFTAVGLSLANYAPLWLVVTLGATLGLSFLAAKVRFLSAGLEFLSDRFIVFLYILMPLTALALVDVLVRNL